MAFNFENLNYERKFDYDVTNIRGKYTDCEEMFTKYGSEKVFRVNALYISTASKYDPEKPMAALDETYLNLPVHLLDEVKGILNDKEACQQINNGEVGVSFYSYIKKLKKKFKNGTEKEVKKTCYSVKWVDLTKYAYDEDEDEDDEYEDDDE